MASVCVFRRWGVIFDYSTKFSLAQWAVRDGVSVRFLTVGEVSNVMRIFGASLDDMQRKGNARAFRKGCLVLSSSK